MPSKLVVEVCTLDKILPHPNADRLELAHVKGWQAVVLKGMFQADQKVVYFPPDTVLSKELTDSFGVTQYTQPCEQGQRIRQAKLRGEPSFGLLITANPAWELGMDVADQYNAVKYNPPLRLTAGDAEVEHPLFTQYTDIENMRNYPAVFQDGEEVVVTEKIHGGNCRVGVVDGEEMAGSHETRRKKPVVRIEENIYWFPWTLTGVVTLLRTVPSENLARVVILYGEVYGKVQSLHYGVKGLAFRAFDLCVDGRYLDYDNFKGLCARFGVETVPLLYQGPFSLAKIAELSRGPSIVIGADHLREGVVVRPVVERTDPKIGRVVLKYLSDDYLVGKHHDNEIADA